VFVKIGGLGQAINRIGLNESSRGAFVGTVG
jgi:hypothetical protein